MEPNTPDLHSLKDTLAASLKLVSEMTEEVYLGMTETYPALIRELDIQIGVGSSEKDTLSSMVDEALASIAKRSATYQEQQTESAQLILLLKDLLVTMETLQTHVDEIHEDSIQMELISLNALVAASKAGAAGKGFSCITTELKQLSSQTMELTVRSAEIQTEIDSSFSHIKSSLEELDSEELTTLKDFHHKILGIFQQLKDVASEITDGLNSVRRRADEIKKPIMKIVVEVQNQDRIRQGIDQIFLLFQELPELDSVNNEKKLEALAYLDILPGLCRMILEETEDQIQSNLRVFSQSIEEADQMVERLEGERRRFLSHHLDTVGESSILQTFQNSQNCFLELKNFHTGMTRKRQMNLRGSQGLKQSVEILVEVLSSFDKIIEKFRNIDVASRIEVARYAELAVIKDNTLASTQLTKKIDSDVHGSAQIAKDFSQRVTELLTNYNQQFDRRILREKDLETDLEGMIQLMAETRKTFTQTLQENQILTGTFLEKLNGTKNDLIRLSQLKQKISEQYDILDYIKKGIEDEKQKLVAEMGLTEWNPDKAKLQAVIDRFTIFVHKQKAAEMADYRITASAESGDVTLF